MMPLAAAVVALFAIGLLAQHYKIERDCLREEVNDLEKWIDSIIDTLREAIVDHCQICNRHRDSHGGEDHEFVDGQVRH